MKLFAQEALAESAFDAAHLVAIASLLKNTYYTFETDVRGSSMGAALPEGRIRVRFAADTDLRIGRVLMYLAQDRAVAHRFIRRMYVGPNEYFITRGDATAFCDAPVRRSAVVGVVTEFFGGGKWQGIGPPPAHSLVHRAVAAMLVYTSAGLLRLHPKCANWWTLGAVAVRRTGLKVWGRIRRSLAPFLEYRRQTFRRRYPKVF
jgi:hypothetical protein